MDVPFDLMKNPFIFCIILLTLSYLVPHPSRASTVKLDVIHSQDQYQIEGTYPIILRLKISKSWYIHGTKKTEGLIPTVLTFHGSSGLRVNEIRFPDPEKKKFDYTPKPIEVFSGDILVRATLKVHRNAPSGDQVIKGNLSYQACSSNACLPPKDVPITITVSVVPQGTGATALNQEIFPTARDKKDVEKDIPGVEPGAGLWLTLLAIFLGGLALNLTPCVYPLIPITVSYFSGRGRRIMGHTLLHGLIYISGLALTNSLLGLSAALSGGILGSALQNPFVLILVAAIMTTLGLSFFGFWEFRIPAGLTRLASKNYRGYFGTFFMGLTLGIVAAPCLGPFMLGLLTYVGQKGAPLLGFLYFFILSLGLGLPLSILAVFSASVEKLPITGDWMVWVRKLMGWVLLSMAAYMVDPLISHYLAEYGLMVGVIMAAGIHLGWLESSGSAKPKFVYLKRAIGIILVGGGILYLFSPAYDKEGIQWLPYDQEIISRASKDKKPLILDFYAEWCGPCKAMEKKVFRDPQVVTLSRHLITMRVDLTRREPYQEEVLNRYHVMGVPTLVFLNREGVEEKVLRVESLVGKTEFLSRIKWLLEKPPSPQE